MVDSVQNGSSLIEKASQIQLVLTDCDGVLTDGGVYYSARGEEMKRFSIRDGMGVERLRQLAGVEVGLITGEDSDPVRRRAEKLHITELHLGVKNKLGLLRKILERQHVRPEQVAYLGDDVNDIEVMEQVGLAACPADATVFARELADYICPSNGGYGAFRDLAEFIIAAKECNAKTLDVFVEESEAVFR